MSDPTSDRYRSLDAWRGFAALSVAIFHCTNTLLKPGQSALADLLLAGWAGVYIFFPISGYCILAALHTPANATFSRFVFRRWRRIFPPYWASIAVIAAITLLARPFNHTQASELHMPLWKWVSIATLTQTLAGASQQLNPVYWSLCYEEQFYLVMALSLFMTPRLRSWWLLLVTALAVWYGSPWCPFVVEGLFLKLWLAFAAGVVVYASRDVRYSRWFCLAMAALVLLGAGFGRDPGLWVSSVAALALSILRPYDARIAGSGWANPLMKLGTISYSLYLLHVPTGGRTVNLLRRGFADPTAAAWMISPLALVVAAGSAFLFYRLVERRFKGALSPDATGHRPTKAAAEGAGTS